MLGRYDERWSKPIRGIFGRDPGKCTVLIRKTWNVLVRIMVSESGLDSDIKDDIDVAPVPSINGKQATVIHGLGNCIYKDTKNPEAAWKWVEFLSGEEANKLSAEMGAAIPAYEGTADIWVDKNKAYNLSTFVTASKEYSYPYPVSKNTAEWEQYQAEELKKAYNFQVDVKDACDTLAEKMNEVLASE